MQVESVTLTLSSTQITESKTLQEPIKANDSRHPALRRAALVLIGLQLDAVVRNYYDSREAGDDSISDSLDRLRLPGDVNVRVTPISSGEKTFGNAIDQKILDRTRIILGYVAATDEDTLVRQQAGEALAILGELLSGGFFN